MVDYLIFFYLNTSIFQKRIQNNSVFKKNLNLPHFEEEASDELTSALKFREEMPIRLASPPCVANPIGAYVLSFEGDYNWCDTCVCFVIFLKEHCT